MNLWLRTLLIYISAWRRPQVSVMDETRIRLRTLPTDLDIAIHMNNGRYLTIADLGRWDLMIRCRFWPKMRSRGWHPVVGTSKVWHRASLQPFQPFDLTTRILFWDEKWSYLEHRFEGVGPKAGKVYCRVVVKTLFLKGREKVPTKQLIHEMGFDGDSPPMDAELVQALA
ncbi:MAG: thioesterase family protein [Pseudomonadota bacterium]